MEVAKVASCGPSAYIVFALSKIGHSHKKSGKPCQDSSDCCYELGNGGAKYTCIIVADGHGGDAYFRSDLGSKFAVDAAMECLTKGELHKALTDLCHQNEDATPVQREKEKERGRTIQQIKGRIIGRWNELVKEHFESNPFSEDELSGIPSKYAEKYSKNEGIEHAYGTTLISVLWTDAFLLALQMGDGNCVIVDDGGAFLQPLPEDERCFLNITTSICDTDAINSFRHYFSQNHPCAAIIGTDGITDSFAGDKGLYNFYRLVLTSFSQNDNDNEESEKLADYLPRLSQKGSGDDVSIAMIANRELIKNIDFSEPEDIDQDQEDDKPIIREIDEAQNNDTNEIPVSNNNVPIFVFHTPVEKTLGDRLDVVADDT
ncbi:MAG: protein phosphatase 2C domain-containing protein [Holophagales bacterium]|jgi:serine/threonine protein phosphatase PrpC|nr:protein phosphatase 2C domain-containing protein [Holophagales bacterium]